MGAVAACFASTVCECACCLACSCCKGICGTTLSQATRIGHILVVIALYALAVIIGKSIPNEINGYESYTKVELEHNCNHDYKEECIYRQLIYRASFSLVLTFFAIGSLCACFPYVNRSFWILKFGGSIAVFIGFWWGENTFFGGWAEFARFVSFFWLLIQSFLLFDFAHDCHNMIMMKADEADKENSGEGRKWLVFYLLLCAGCFTATVVGMVYLYRDYAGCDLGAFFISFTLICGVISTLLSLLNTINIGLLPPLIMFAYSTFICWYALLSHPNKECNPSAGDVSDPEKDASLIVISLVTGLVLLYCIVNGTAILDLFDAEGQGVMMHQTGGKKSKSGLDIDLTGATTSEPSSIPTVAKDDDKPEEEEEDKREMVFFHILMLLLSCYGTMILTNWGKNTGAPDSVGSETTSRMSMWLIILSQWFFLLCQFRALYVAWDNNR